MFTVELPCKPYVKRFLEINFGDPVNLAPDKELNAKFRTCLSRQCSRYETRIGTLSEELYRESAKIVISNDEFNRFGWEITQTETVEFGRTVERRTKFMMRMFVSYYSTLMEERQAVLYFQEKFGFSEDIWSYDSILKDYRRNRPERMDVSRDIYFKIEKMISANLKKLGAISHKSIKFIEESQMDKFTV